MGHQLYSRTAIMEEVIEKELQNVKKKFKDVEGAELISCVRVMVQIKIT